MKIIPLTNGGECLVDDADFEFVSQWRWRKLPSGHVYRSESIRKSIGSWTKRAHYLHRVLMDAPKGMLVDHEDLNPLNNQRSNLRLATKSQNNANSEPRKNNPSGYKGVYPYFKRWRAQIKTSGKTINLGHYDTPIEASEAYGRAALQIYGEFARCPHI